ncbi:MAG: dihydrodipicolinate synthase family protein [Chloroflexota bacterium]
MSQLVKGLITPAVTIFQDDESLDEQRTRDHIRFLVDSGVNAIIAGGSSAEFIALKFEDRKRLLAAILEEVGGRVPVYAGTGHYSTRLTIELSKFAQKAGASGLLVILPYYLTPPRRFVFDHYRALREAVDIPLILYNGLDFVGYHLSPTEVAQLVEEGVVQGIKENDTDVSTIRMLKDLCGDRLFVYSGPDSTGLEAFCAGADGWCGGVLQNLVPGICAEFYRLIAQGCLAEARELWGKLFPLVRLTCTKQSDGYPHFIQIIKAGLNLLGRHGGKPVRPLLPLGDAEAKRLAAIFGGLQRR